MCVNTYRVLYALLFMRSTPPHPSYKTGLLLLCRQAREALGTLLPSHRDDAGHDGLDEAGGALQALRKGRITDRCATLACVKAELEARIADFELDTRL